MCKRERKRASESVCTCTYVVCVWCESVITGALVKASKETKLNRDIVGHGLDHMTVEGERERERQGERQGWREERKEKGEPKIDKFSFTHTSTLWFQTEHNSQRERETEGRTTRWKMDR